MYYGRTIGRTKFYFKLLKIIANFNLYPNKDYLINMIKIPIGKTQIEAVKIIDKNNFWITAEDESGIKYARLLKLKI